jgi:hypothetical protein
MALPDPGYSGTRKHNVAFKPFDDIGELERTILSLVGTD